MAAQSKPAPPIGPWGRAAAGAAGAVFANTLVYPLDLVKTKLQVQVKRRDTDKTTSSSPAEGSAAINNDGDGDVDDAPYVSTWDVIRRITATEGPTGLYAGMSGSLIGVASTNFAYFYWYSVVRTVWGRYQGGGGAAATSPSALLRPSTAVELSLGAVAGALAQLFTIPIAVVTTRQQTQSAAERKGLFATAREVIEGEDGVSGLWRGLKASLVLVVNPAITYGAYERLKDAMFPGKSNLKPSEAFLLGATSKALATLVTQPLIVAKVGLQSKPPPGRQGKPFKSFVQVMRFIVDNEGVLGLFKGIGPQVLKGLLVQGILMMAKERVELLFILFLRYLRKMRSHQLARAANLVAGVKMAMPATMKLR